MSNGWDATNAGLYQAAYERNYVRMTNTEGVDRLDGGATRALGVTAWPGSPIPVPGVYRPHIRELDGDVLVLEMPSLSASAVISLPQEFFLRELLDVDLSDTRSITDFTREYGLLLFSRARHVGSRGAEQRFWSPQRSLEELRRSLAQELQAHAGGSGRDPRSAAADPEMLPVVALLRSVHAQLVGAYPAGVMVLHVDDVRLLAAEYRDLVRIWLDFALGGEEHRTRWESPHLPVPDDTAAFLASHLEPDLRRFTPRAVPVAPSASATDPNHTWSLNAAIAAQLYNDLVERPAYRRCALDDCSRVFARARGRSEHGRHRSDAKYCSKSCADLEMKRRQRERKSSTSS